MILDSGEKVHIIERRYFTSDLRRHFIGQILKCTGNALRAKGRVWVFDDVQGKFVCKSEVRERVITLGERLTINVIPQETNLNDVTYEISTGNELVVTDGKKFSLEITEFTAMR